jgi:hypothetical protein
MSKKYKGSKPAAKKKRTHKIGGIDSENVRRDCLRCERQFFAPNKYVRLCVHCKNLDVFEEDSEGRYSIVIRR